MRKVKGIVAIYVVFVLIMGLFDFISFTGKYIGINRTNVMLAEIAKEQNGFLLEAPENYPGDYVTLNEAIELVEDRLVNKAYRDTRWQVLVNGNRMSYFREETGIIPYGEKFPVEVELEYKLKNLPNALFMIPWPRYHTMRTKRTVTSEWNNVQ